MYILRVERKIEYTDLKAAFHIAAAIAEKGVEEPIAIEDETGAELFSAKIESLEQARERHFGKEEVNGDRKKQE